MRFFARTFGFLCLLTFCILGLAPGACLAQADADWPAYGRDDGGMRYSPASQINPNNVGQLRVVWMARTGTLDQPSVLDKKAAFEATPILVEDKLVLTTPFDQVLALNPGDGAILWRYDPHLDFSHGYSEVTSRGAASWKDSRRGPAARACRMRIFLGTLDGRLIALDGKTGKLCVGFGVNGQVDLTRSVDLRDKGDYEVTSAPSVIGDLVIVGSSIADNRAVSLERGIVRAYDAHTGRLRWAWDPIPWANSTRPRTGAGNAWSTISVDETLGLVFVPTGSASPDYYGGIREGDNKYADSVVALRASTGELVWGFQVVHHDLWDYDVASQPTLFGFQGGKPAIAITTKMGRIFVLDRVTGKPLLPVEERPAPKSDIPGERAWPTQPWTPISVVPEGLTAADAWGATTPDQQWCAQKIQASRSEGIFTPPSVQGTVVFPGNVGGVNWGSSAYDPTRHLLFVDTNRLAMWVRMIPRADYPKAEASGTGERLGAEFAAQSGAPYALYREALLSPNGLPCNRPPWGTVAAVDIFTGDVKWNVPLGSAVPGKGWGTINLGGPIATASGLVFTAAGRDGYIRAYDSETGKMLWENQLPAGGQATPMTYTFGGHQYLVICAGGHGKLGTKQGDYVLAYALK
jgi:quinoprotein glucose dehydrogenase